MEILNQNYAKIAQKIANFAFQIFNQIAFL